MLFLHVVHLAAALSHSTAVLRWRSDALARPAIAPIMMATTLDVRSTAFPAWPESAIKGRRDLSVVIEAFEQAALGVPLNAASAKGDDYRAWLDGGFAAHRFINAKLSRQTYVPILQLLLQLMVGIQERYPDLYAVLKFVPKKNGLNPLLASLQARRRASRHCSPAATHTPSRRRPFLAAQSGVDPESMRINEMRPREVRRRLDDLKRALEQSWLLLGVYLTLPGRPERDDFLWAARTVVEKVKTDQRSRALELLCLGFFHRDAAMYPLVIANGIEGKRWPLKKGFEKNFGVDAWHPKPTNARMIWQRSRMVYPFLECAHRAWLNFSGVPLGQMGPADCNEYEDPELGVMCGESADEEHGAAVGELLDRIARASPQEKVLNSLLYWLIDLSYKVMLEGEDIKPWDPEPYILRRPGVEARMVVEISRLGHLVQLLYCSEHCEQMRGDMLLLQVKEVETTTTLLASIQSSFPQTVEEYQTLLLAPELTLSGLEHLEFDALGVLLGLDGDFVRSRGDTVRRALSEWRNPELLFRYLEDNQADARMHELITRWLRSIFGLSEETLRMIRRENPANVRHLLMIPQDILLRWYSETYATAGRTRQTGSAPPRRLAVAPLRHCPDCVAFVAVWSSCPGTSMCKTLFMLGEDAGSCLRIISNDGNKYNRALMGYVLQSHVRALVVTDAVGRVMVRSLIRLVLRSDTLTPVIFCDPMFFTLGFSRDLQRELLAQVRGAAALAAWRTQSHGAPDPHSNDAPCAGTRAGGAHAGARRACGLRAARYERRKALRRPNS